MSMPFIPTDEASGQAEENFDYAPPLDLQRELIPRPASTFLLVSDATHGSINPGDILVVDRSLSLVRGKLVIAEHEGELRVMRHPVAEVWGVVTHIIHKT